ncbi:Ribonuclease PH [Polystyrenella longa]|uniref:Ribonuclease PH n=1 Tax=Polystyrenella longa TaxID=2528007 RepID=A0A518CGF6_9PLAN|nr:ribonuclease PH [Polystyrenella longa]QDU78309.1 Ribonuclease PH [Polystyrenella longa]
MRIDGRAVDQLRPITIQRPFTSAAAGSVLISAGETSVLCTASLDMSVPPWKSQDDLTGWVTAEYNMLPGSTTPRKRRERTKIDGRTSEIQRLIGRSLRAIVDLEALGRRSILVDCDVLKADGGTRTLSLTGAYIALADAASQLEPAEGVDRPILKDSVAAISVGVINGEVLLDLNYHEDFAADVDTNVVMTGSGEFVEVQGTAEGQAFSRELLDRQLDLATKGIEELTRLQRETLAG